MLIKIHVFSLMLIAGLSIGYAQQSYICRGKIVDANTSLALRDVRIYKIFNGDTIRTQSNVNGEFQISLQAGSKLFFKKLGYAWQSMKITDNAIQSIQLTKSTSDGTITIVNNRDGTIHDQEKIYLYFNGQLVPKAEQGDALSYDPRSIEGIRINSTEDRIELYIDTH